MIHNKEMFMKSPISAHNSINLRAYSIFKLQNSSIIDDLLHGIPIFPHFVQNCRKNEEEIRTFFNLA